MNDLKASITLTVMIFMFRSKNTTYRVLMCLKSEILLIKCILLSNGKVIFNRSSKLVGNQSNRNWRLDLKV